ncbi:MAG: hypothetical protein MZV63_34315 [Marinilabiliales bacterium]|nr:hypothetical protein [Marinilabiliales bacterium]
MIGSRYGYSMIWLLVRDHARPRHRAGDERPRRRRHGTRARRPRSARTSASRSPPSRSSPRCSPTSAPPWLNSPASPPRASLFHVPSYVAVPVTRHGRLAARHPRLVPQGGARAPRARASCSSPTSSPASSRGRTGARRSTGLRTRYVEWDTPVDLHGHRRRGHHAHAVGAVLHPGRGRRQEGAVAAVQAYTKYEIYAGSVFMTTHRLLHRHRLRRHAATRKASSSSRPRRRPWPSVPFLGGAAQYLFARRPAQRLDPRRRRPAAGHRLRGLRGLRLRVRASTTRSARRRSSTASSPSSMFVPAAVAMIPGPAAGEGHPRRPVAERRPAAGDPHLHAAHDQQPSGDGRARQRARAQRDRLGVLRWR